MNKKFFILPFLFLLTAFDAAAQLDLMSGPDCMELGSRYHRVVSSNFWNTGRNVTGIRQDTVSASYAEIAGRYSAGDFHGYSEGRSVWGAGAGASTITHLARVSFTGSLSFVHSSGYDVCGSMSGRPGYYPFDVLEFTPGTKTRQTYAFSGGVSADIGKRWRIGVEIEYSAANYTKRKDLRHTDYLLDMTVAPSFMYHDGDFAAGLSVIFSKNSETINAEVLGISSSTYYAFLDKGLMYGAYESWEGSGVHLSESGINGLPARELLYGGAVQVQWRKFYAELEYLYSEGKAGEKQVIWFRFPAHRAALRLGYSIDGRSCRHLLRLNVNWSLQHNNESVMQKVTENGVTVPVVYGYNRLFSRMSLSVNPEYELYAGPFALAAGLDVRTVDGTASPMFPYIFTMEQVCAHAYVAASYTVRGWDISAGLSAGGGVLEESDRISSTVAVPETEPFRLEDWYNIKYEYLTAPRITGEIGVRYRFWKGLSAGVGARYTHGFGLEFLDGPGRWTCTLRIGYEF